MPTYVYIGLYQPDTVTNNEDDMIAPQVYVDGDKIQVLHNEDVLVEFMYEELRGIMAIMAAEQEKQHLFIRAQAKNN